MRIVDSKEFCTKVPFGSEIRIIRNYCTMCKDTCAIIHQSFKKDICTIKEFNCGCGLIRIDKEKTNE